MDKEKTRKHAGTSKQHRERQEETVLTAKALLQQLSCSSNESIYELKRKEIKEYVSDFKKSGQYALATEIDQSFHKMSDCLEEFEELLQKLHAAFTTNQRERLEMDMKREMKKVQRQRDQIKCWLNDSSIKDKSLLEEMKCLIESQMERYKDIERECKMREYSDYSLCNTKKELTPMESDVKKLRIWLSDIVRQLQDQIDKFELDMDNILSSSKKRSKVQDELDKVKSSINKHKFHISKLETVMRILANMENEEDMLSEFLPKVEMIKDDLEYYLDVSGSPNSDYEEDDALYEEIDEMERECFGTLKVSAHVNEIVQLLSPEANVAPSNISKSLPIEQPANPLSQTPFGNVVRVEIPSALPAGVTLPRSLSETLEVNAKRPTETPSIAPTQIKVQLPGSPSSQAQPVDCSAFSNVEGVSENANNSTPLTSLLERLYARPKRRKLFDSQMDDFLNESLSPDFKEIIQTKCIRRKDMPLVNLRKPEQKEQFIRIKKMKSQSEFQLNVESVYKLPLPIFKFEEKSPVEKFPVSVPEPKRVPLTPKNGMSMRRGQSPKTPLNYATAAMINQKQEGIPPTIDQENFDANFPPLKSANGGQMLNLFDIGACSDMSSIYRKCTRKPIPHRPYTEATAQRAKPPLKLPVQTPTSPDKDESSPTVLSKKMLPARKPAMTLVKEHHQEKPKLEAVSVISAAEVPSIILVKSQDAAEDTVRVAWPETPISRNNSRSTTKHQPVIEPRLVCKQMNLDVVEDKMRTSVPKTPISRKNTTASKNYPIIEPPPVYIFEPLNVNVFEDAMGLSEPKSPISPISISRKSTTTKHFPLFEPAPVYIFEPTELYVNYGTNGMRSWKVEPTNIENNLDDLEEWQARYPGLGVYWKEPPLLQPDIQEVKDRGFRSAMFQSYLRLLEWERNTERELEEHWNNVTSNS